MRREFEYAEPLHLAAHSERVVATDVNQRALWMTQVNARLNGVSNVEVRDGSFFEPVQGEKFDQIATNPVDTRGTYASAVRELVAEGFLEPV